MNPKISVLWKHFREHPEGNWVMIWENCRELYKFLRETPNIKRVLDLGTGVGCTAAITAMALEDKGEDYHIDSLEQFDKCIKIANELIPEELKKNITIIKSEAEAWQTELMAYKYFSVYKTVPGWDYDLIIQDGPAPWLEEGKYVEIPNGTITKAVLEGNLKPGTLIAWDGRLAALRILNDTLRDNFYIYKVPAYAGGDYNVIQRKDNELKFFDQRKEQVRLMGYFDDPKTDTSHSPA